MIRMVSFRAALTLACAGLGCIGMGAGKLIAIDSARVLYEVDMGTGAKTAIGSISAAVGTSGSLTFDDTTRTLYVSSTSTDSLYAIDYDAAPFVANLVGAYNVAVPSIVMHGIELDSDTGTMFGISSHGTGTFYQVDKTTGAATQIGTVTGTLTFNNLGYNSDRNVMYMTSGGRTGGILEALHTIDMTTGAVTDIGPLGPSTNPNGLAYNPDNGVLYMIDNTTDNLYSVDMSTGAATVIGSMGAGNLLGLVYVPDGAVEVLPTAFTVDLGLLLGGAVADLHASDDSYVVLLCDEFDSNGVISITAASPILNPGDFVFVFETKSSRNDISEFAEMFDFNTNSFTTENFRTAPTADSLVERTVLNPERVIGANGEINAKFRYVPQADIDAGDGWTMSIDTCKFIVSPL